MQAKKDLELEMSDSKVTNVVFAGLGGQGVLKASDVLAETAFAAGLDVKKSEVHGMSQRGGSVASDVRFGASVLSPMVPAGEADYVVVLAAEEVENNRRHLRAGGVLITPDSVDAAKLPHAKSLNIALLGVLSAHLDLPTERWLAAVRASLPAKLHEVNEKAFELGRQAAKG
jgi:indolepyruvate ferredoxin oxidoreductase beta subunit